MLTLKKSPVAKIQKRRKNNFDFGKNRSECEKKEDENSLLSRCDQHLAEYVYQKYD